MLVEKLIELHIYRYDFWQLCLVLTEISYVQTHSLFPCGLDSFWYVRSLLNPETREETDPGFRMIMETCEGRQPIANH